MLGNSRNPAEEEKRTFPHPPPGRIRNPAQEKKRKEKTDCRAAAASQRRKEEKKKEAGDQTRIPGNSRNPMKEKEKRKEKKGCPLTWRLLLVSNGMRVSCRKGERVFLLPGRYASSTAGEASMGSWYCHCKVFCSLIICNLRKIVKNSIQGPNLFRRILSGIMASLFILCVLAFYTLYKIVSFLVDRPSLPTENFYTFGGTTTALLPVGDDVYMTVVSRTMTGVHAARSGDYTDILKISRKDFLAKRSTFERVARVEGQITVAALSHDGKTLYFFQRPPSEPGEVRKELFCGFDLKTGVISPISEESASVGLRLVDVDGKYLLLYWDTYAGASLDGGRTWHTLLKDRAELTYVTVADGALYLVRGDELRVMPEEAITAGTFQEEKLRDLAPGMKIDSLLVDRNHVVHLSGSRGKADAAAEKERRRLFLVSLDGSPAVPFPALRVGKAYTLSKLYFARGKDIYCRMSGADTPFARETRLLKITGDTIRRSRAFEESPNLLGTLGDYLIFTVDAVWQRKSFLFGIKYM